jgi:hypothetical protein
MHAVLYPPCLHPVGLLTLPLKVVTLSLKHRDRRTSILCMGPSAASLATSSKNSLRRILKSCRTQRRVAGSPLLLLGCSGSISSSSTCSQDMLLVPSDSSLRVSCCSVGSTCMSRDSCCCCCDCCGCCCGGCCPGWPQQLSAKAANSAASCSLSEPAAGVRGTRLPRLCCCMADVTVPSSPGALRSVSSCSRTTP